jgi:cytochrome bd ubiquinol oxidase subunit II
MIVLWLLILRGISIEFRSLEANPLWRSFWDTTFAFSSTVIAVVLGASLGNVIRGVPLDGTGFFHAPLFTNLRTGREPGALDWYTLLVGAYALVLLAGHGTLYLAWKTEGVVGDRCTRLAPRLWMATLALLLPVTVATAIVQPALFARLAAYPTWWLLALPILGGPLAVFLSLRRANPLGAFLGSSAFIAATMVATSAGLFPYLLRSTLADPHSLTIHNASSAHHGLLLGFLWWTPAMLLALGYFTYLFRSFRGKVHPSDYSH